MTRESVKGAWWFRTGDLEELDQLVQSYRAKLETEERKRVKYKVASAVKKFNGDESNRRLYSTEDKSSVNIRFGFLSAALC